MRWNLFPEVRVPQQGALFDDADEKATVPDLLRVMDLQQEQLARSLGDGHRVIYGVAGSGKTMILGYRAEYLAKATADAHKPVLVLCYNEPLAIKLQATMLVKGLADRVQVRHFHKWCRDRLVALGQPLPSNDLAVGAKMEQMVRNVINGVDRKMIPSGQYLAVLIDEGHDFAPEWLKLVTQMVDPATNSLLLLYDDAHSIYDKRSGKPFSFKSVGVQAQGRTTILRINYRNTRQILQTDGKRDGHRAASASGEGRRWRSARSAGELRQGRAGADRHRTAEHPCAGRPDRGAHGERAQDSEQDPSADRSAEPAPSAGGCRIMDGREW
ncbi:UvrD-helicase domain-containing protein [Variovorax gossypii]|uniref:UvrD-helicase domain-containing protein n=1 Tax=Variovorax gossypii TaxID=1679495 RepID=UPI003B82F983